MSNFDRRTYAREYARRKRDQDLARRRLASRTCPRRFGKSGVCGGTLDSYTDGNGRLIVRCQACERFERGICRDCNLPVDGAVRKARRCATHKAQAVRQSLYRYAADNRKLLRKRARESYRKSKAVRERRNAYMRLWRKVNRDKVRAQKRRYALRQPQAAYEYQRKRRERERELLAGRERARHHGIIEARTCLSPTCITPVTGRVKKCAQCKERERLDALKALAPIRGRGKRTDLRRAA